MEHFLNCPECGYENLQGSTSCKRCLLIFSKYEKKNLATGITVSASSALESIWQSLLSDFDNMSLHEKFIGQALSEKNLPFASQQYRKMKELNPADETSTKMIEKIIQVATLAYTQRQQRPRQAKKLGWPARIILFLLFMILFFIISQFFAAKQIPKP